MLESAIKAIEEHNPTMTVLDLRGVVFADVDKEELRRLALALKKNSAINTLLLSDRNFPEILEDDEINEGLTHLWNFEFH